MKNFNLAKFARLFACAFLIVFSLAGCQKDAGKSKSEIASNGEPKSLEATDSNSSSALAKGKTALVAYYFHGNKRCKTCVQMQEWVYNSLNKNFKAELDAGKIIWREVNYDEPANAHFRKDYKLMFPTAILASVKDGKETGFISLEDAWDFADNAVKLDGFVAEKTKTALQGLN